MLAWHWLHMLPNVMRAELYSFQLPRVEGSRHAVRAHKSLTVRFYWCRYVEGMHKPAVTRFVRAMGVLVSLCTISSCAGQTTPRSQTAAPLLLLYYLHSSGANSYRRSYLFFTIYIATCYVGTRSLVQAIDRCGRMSGRIFEATSAQRYEYCRCCEA